MPSPEHAEARTSRSAGGPRAGWQLPVEYDGVVADADASDRPPSLLSPFLHNLPITGFPDMSGLKGFLPSPTPAASPAPVPEPVREDASKLPHAQWADLGGSTRVLLLTSPTHALQVFAFRNGTIPDDAHVTETFPAPEEAASVPEITYDADTRRTALPGIAVRKTPTEERVLGAQLLHQGLWGDRGPVVAMTLCSTPARAPHGHLAVVLLSLRTGKVFRRVDLGKGLVAGVQSSSRAVVISLSHPASIHVLSKDLEPLSHYGSVPTNPQTHLPICSLSGRLLAYVTNEAATVPGAERLGSITQAATKPRARVSSASSPPPTTQGALLSSAVEIGGGVARGVWEGLKAGAKAAREARSTRLATSAPSERSVLEGSPPLACEAESRSVEDGVTADAASPASGQWIKIVDLAPTNSDASLVSHFRLPPSRLLPLPNEHGPVMASRDVPASFLAFSPQGTRLFAASADGRAFHVLDIRPRGPLPSAAPVKGEVWGAYVLRRGNTSASVRAVTWSRDERWIAVGTAKGTLHVFPICPNGGKPSARSHVPLKIPNATELPALSVEVSPAARLRPPRVDDDERAHLGTAVASFVASRPDPVNQGTLCEDVAIYRPATGTLDVVRLSVRAAPRTPGDQRRGSNLTEMIRDRSGLRSGDLDVEPTVKARWGLPLGGGTGEPVLPLKEPKPAAASPPSRSLYHAEIRTHSAEPRILPATIYLSHQVDFFAAKPTDEYSPLSVLEREARTRRLVYRTEVEVLPIPGTDSFNAPLSSALHSVLDSRPSPQVPALPNGSPRGSPWGGIPRQIAAQVGDGVDRVRREYARVSVQRRLSRSKREDAAGTPLSFEDDTVLASATDDASPPSLIVTSDPGKDDSDWSDRWDEEYRAAIEDEGPDDLVLGLMDEEEEERRRWEKRTRELRGGQK